MSTVYFDVYGRNMDELRECARRELSGLTGSPPSAFPDETYTLDVSSNIQAYQGEIVQWVARVTYYAD